jgi:hypothetical protein
LNPGCNIAVFSAHSLAGFAALHVQFIGNPMTAKIRGALFRFFMV